jgi:hypothetical protein
VEKIWINIDAEFTSRANKQSLNDTSKKTSHKAIRIFVSSTFTDFFNEREILVKQVILIKNIILIFILSIKIKFSKVFPELKEWCSERRLDLVECDL